MLITTKLLMETAYEAAAEKDVIALKSVEIALAGVTLMSDDRETLCSTIASQVAADLTAVDELISIDKVKGMFLLDAVEDDIVQSTLLLQIIYDGYPEMVLRTSARTISPERRPLLQELCGTLLEKDLCSLYKQTDRTWDSLLEALMEQE